ncbi:MAG: YdeI family protein [Bacteroidota bacterium]
MDPKFFPKPEDLRKWFIENHETETELIVGYYKKSTGIPSIDWPQSVDEALCFGWIDGVRNGIDEKSYQIRFTPRRPKGHWSAVNIKKIEKLIEAKRMYPAGLKVWQERDKKNQKKASFEQKRVALAKEYKEQIKANPDAWVYFSKKLSPYFRKASIHWVMSAKQENTRQRRLGILIESSANGEKVPVLRLAGKSE